MIRNTSRNFGKKANSAETNVQLSHIHEHLFARKCFRYAHNHRAFRVSTPTPPLFSCPLDAYFLISFIESAGNNKCL